MVSDTEPGVGEKRDRVRGEAENMKKAGRRIRRSAAITERICMMCQVMIHTSCRS